MKASRRLALIVSILALTSALTGTLKTYATNGNMTTFFDSEIPGIRVQLNATAQTQPGENLTVMFSLSTQTDVCVERLSLEVFGFLNGTEELSLGDFTDSSLSLNDTSKEYNYTCHVPDQVWGVTYGQISLTYSASLGGLDLRFSNVTNGFPMTQIENTLLENLEEEVKNLNASYNQLNTLYLNLNSTFQQLNQTYWELHQNYTSVQGSLGELDNTRRLTTVLAITTVFFVATTIYLVLRRPREPW